MISVLVSSRMDSKYLAKFLMGLYSHTEDPTQIDLHVMLNSNDRWNKDLVESLPGLFGRTTYHRENYGLGRYGLHKYFNQMVPDCRGDWIIYFCDDHFFIDRVIWDRELYKVVDGLDPEVPWCIVPKFDNAGAMNHVLSRGYVRALDNSLAKHGNLDSYINDVNAKIPQSQIILVDDEWFNDFTHDVPTPMDERSNTPALSHDAYAFAEQANKDYADNVRTDADKINEALK